MKKHLFIFAALAFSSALLRASEPSSQVYSHFLNALVLERNGELERALSEYNKSLELDPRAGTILRQRANLHLRMGNPEKALSDTQNYVKEHPNDLESLKLLANIYMMKGQAEGARLSLEKVIELDPKDAQSILDLALLLMQDDAGASVKVLEKLIKLQPQSIEAHYHLGLAYQKLGQAEKSKAAFEKVIAIDPSSLPSLFLLGQMSEREGKMSEAAQYYESALDKMPDNTSLRMQLLTIYASRTDLAAVERLLEYFKDDSNAPVEANLWLGVAAESKKDWDGALKYYLKAQSQADTPEIHIRLASIYSHLGNVKETLKSLNILIEKNPENPQYHYFLGLAYLDLKKSSKAVSEFERAIRINPKFSSAYFQLGIAFDQQNDWDKAEKSLRQAVAVDSGNASAYNYIGYTLADRGINLFEARRMIERALELEHNNPAFIDSLGWLDYREKNYKQALMHLKSAVELASDPIIYEHLADCQRDSGNLSDASLSYAKSLELDPDNAKVKDKLQALNRFLVPTSPARKLLKAFEYRLRQATNISGPFFIKGNFGLAFSQGIFYLRREDSVLAVSSADSKTDLRVDLLNSVMTPSVTLRYKSLPSALSIFPPEFKKEVPQETETALETVAAFLNGSMLASFDSQETAVQEKRGEFILTNAGRTLTLDKKQESVREISTPACRIVIDRYKIMGDVALPETLKFSFSGRSFEIRFTALSLDKIESRIFSENPGPR